MDGIITALPDDFLETLLGVIVVAGSALLVFSSLLAVVRRRRAEKNFLSVLADSMRKNFMQDKNVLERAKEGELTGKDREELGKVIFEALLKLDDPADKDSIQRALKQPSPRGRDNYERKILSESARRALQELEATNAAGKATREIDDEPQQDQGSSASDRKASEEGQEQEVH